MSPAVRDFERRLAKDGRCRAVSEESNATLVAVEPSEVLLIYKDRGTYYMGGQLSS